MFVAKIQLWSGQVKKLNKLFSNQSGLCTKLFRLITSRRQDHIEQTLQKRIGNNDTDDSALFVLIVLRHSKVNKNKQLAIKSKSVGLN